MFQPLMGGEMFLALESSLAYSAEELGNMTTLSIDVSGSSVPPFILLATPLAYIYFKLSIISYNQTWNR